MATVCGGLVCLTGERVEEVVPLAVISVRNVNNQLWERLQARAVRHGRSLESEVRAILEEAVREPQPWELANGVGNPNGGVHNRGGNPSRGNPGNPSRATFQGLVDRFDQGGGVDLDVPPYLPPPPRPTST